MPALQVVRLPVSSRNATGRDAPGRLIPFAPYALAELHREDAVQAEWNRLPALVAEACSWRDPESIAAVEGCVARLKELVRREWAGDSS